MRSSRLIRGEFLTHKTKRVVLLSSVLHCVLGQDFAEGTEEVLHQMMAICSRRLLHLKL